MSDSKYPEYVTDGHHIYIWNNEFAGLFEDGKLKESGPPVVRKTKKQIAEEQLQALRDKAAAQADKALKDFEKKQATEVKNDDEMSVK